MAKEKLFNLVQSLTAREKKFFHQYARRHVQETETIYLRLFDAIAEQDEYDEDAIKAQFQNPSFEKNFHNPKGYLYDLILRSLVMLKREDSAYSRALEGLSMTEILCEKLLFAEAIEQLQKVRAIAEEYEFREIELDSYRWMDVILATTQMIRDVNVVIEDNYTKKMKLIEQVSLLTEYRQLYLRLSMLSINATTPNPRLYADAMTLLKNSPLTTDGQPDYLAGKQWHIGLKFIKAKFTGNKIEALQLSGQMVSLFESYPKEFYLYEFLLIYSYFNFINECIDCKEMEAASASIVKLGGLKPASVQNRYFHFHLLFANQLFHLKETGRNEDCIALIDEFEKGLDKYEYTVNRKVEFRNYLSVINYLVTIKEYDRALTFIIRILNETPQQDALLPYALQARLLNMVVHFELANYDLLDHLIRQTEYFFSTRKPEWRFPKELLQLFRRLLKPNTNAVREFEQLRQKLKEQEFTGEEKMMVDSFLSCGWLERSSDHK